MNELYKYLGKRIKVYTKRGNIRIGIVVDHIRQGEDEPDDEEAIVLEIDGLTYLIQLNISEIVSIESIN